MAWEEIYLCVLLFLSSMCFIGMIFDIQDQEKQKHKKQNGKGGD
jgi:hypothetical protein